MNFILRTTICRNKFTPLARNTYIAGPLYSLRVCIRTFLMHGPGRFVPIGWVEEDPVLGLVVGEPLHRLGVHDKLCTVRSADEPKRRNNSFVMP